MNIDDHALIIELFAKTPGVTVREADSFENIKNYLQRNPNLNFVKVIDAQIVGYVMRGHDGRRGYLQYFLVLPEYRQQGFGQLLFNRCIKSLSNLSIDKTHIFVFKTNVLANDFWKSKGWELRKELNMYSVNASTNKNV